MNTANNLLNSIPFGYAYHKLILDNDGEPSDYTFLEINRAFEKITGLERKQLIGNTLLNVLPGIINSEFDWIKIYGNIALNGGEKEFEQYVERLKKWFRVHVSSSEKMFFTTTFIDITEFKKSNDELERFFSVTLDLLCIADLDGNFLKVNNAWTDVLGYSTEFLKERKFLDFVHPDDIQATLDAMKSLEEEKNVLNFVNRYRCKDGTYRFIEWRSRPDGDLIYTAARDITKRVEREEELKKLTLAVEQNPASIITTDRDGVIEYVNAKFTDITGYSYTEIIGKKPNILKSGKQPAEFYNRLWQTITNGKSWSGEILNKKKSGELYWESSNISPVLDNEGEITHFMAIKQDITKQKAIEAKLLESEKRFREIFENLPLISVQGYDRNRRVIYWNKASEKLYGYSQKEAMGCNLEDLIIPDIMKDEVVSNIQNWLDNDIAIPPSELSLKRKDGSTVYVYSNHVMLENLDGKKELFCIDLDLTDHIVREKELNRVKNQYQALANNMPGIIYRCRNDKDRTMLYMNLFTKNITGYTASEFINNSKLSYRELIHSEDTLRVAETVKQAVQEKQNWEIEYRIRNKNGSVKWVYETGQEILDEDTKQPNLEGFIIDITENKKVQLDRNELLDRLKLLGSHLPGFIYQFLLKPDGSSCFPYASDGIELIYGITSEQVKEDASAVYHVIHPDDLKAVKQSISESAASLLLWQAQYRINLPSGKTIWVDGSATPQKLQDGSILWHGYIYDITKRKNKDQEVEYQKNILNALFELSALGIALNEYDTGKFIDANPKLIASTGYTKDELMSLNYWDLTPKEYEKQEAIALQQMESYGYYDKFEKEYIRKDGSKYPVVLRGVVIKDMSRRKMIWSIVEDISKEKKAENELKKLSSAIEQSPASVVITDTNGFIEYVNPKFTEVTGYSIEEAFGKQPSILKSGLQPPETYKELWNSLTAGKTWRGELHNRKKNGELYWEMASISPIIDLGGKTTHYLAVKEDITELKNAEQVILKNLNEKNVLLSEVHHRVKNNMAKINSLLGLQIEFSDLDKRTRMVIKELQTRVKSMAIVHELVYQNDNVSQINIGDLVGKISDNITSIFKHGNKNISINIESDSTSIDLNVSVPFSLLMNELITNIWKHAFDGYTNGEIHINMLSKAKLLYVLVSDNGKGVSDLKKLEKPDSYGYTIIHGLVGQINGTISFSNIPTGGLNVDIQIPLA